LIKNFCTGKDETIQGGGLFSLDKTAKEIDRFVF